VADPFLGEIRLFAGNFAPKGWLLCDGQPLSIAANDALFQLIGTTYGGDGTTTFALPDLRSRLPIHQGTGPDGIAHIVGEAAGVETVTLTTQQIPSHTHSFMVSTSAGATNNASLSVVAASPNVDLFFEDVPGVNMNAAAASASGGSQPHENVPPFLCLNFIIAVDGIFPSQG
jgi:microcystin-dependent protein